MNVEDILIETLETFDYPVKRQGSFLADEAYPDNFFTFWNNKSNSERFYDNSENTYVYDYSINFYSNDPAQIYSIMRLAIQQLRAAGFIISGDGHDVASDEETHDGRGITCLYVDKL